MTREEMALTDESDLTLVIQTVDDTVALIKEIIKDQQGVRL